jgi:elongation factor P
MQAINIKKGKALLINGDVLVVLDRQHVTPGKGRGYIQATLRNTRTGKSVNMRFRSNEDVEFVQIVSRKMQYLYRMGDLCHFMDAQNYEEKIIPLEVLGDALNFLPEGGEADIELYEGNPIGIQLQAAVTLKVTETAPGARGDTVTNVMKPAKLETGHEIQTPLFLNEGDSVRVDTRTGKYISRA